MQFSNIARDIEEDARLGRVYLPERWLVQGGTSVAQVSVILPLVQDRLAAWWRKPSICTNGLDLAHSHAAAVVPCVDQCSAAALSRDRTDGA